ncbi:MAG: hypothetical protein ACI8ZB_004375 [Desulforhopalus sp.]|jgi:hypothetical protein
MSIKVSKAAVSIKKNRLTLTIAEKISKKSIDNLYTEIRFCVADLKPGFDVITDLSACTLAALSSFPTFRKITNHLIDSRVGRVVRVIDETKIIKKQLLNLSARSQSYRADIFSSVEAADEYLSNSDDNSGLHFQLHELPVNYTYKGKQGTGVVEFLSVNECEVQSATLELEVGAKIMLSIKFDTHENLLERLEASSQIIGVEGSSFCARFEDVDDANKEQLWERLVHESQCELT